MSSSIRGLARRRALSATRLHPRLHDPQVHDPARESPPRGVRRLLLPAYTTDTSTVHDYGYGHGHYPAEPDPEAQVRSAGYDCVRTADEGRETRDTCGDCRHR